MSGRSPSAANATRLKTTATAPARGAAGVYRLEAEFAASTVADDASWSVPVTIPPGTLVSCDAWVGFYDACDDAC